MEIRNFRCRQKKSLVARGVVNNITQTIQSIQQAIQEAENNSGYKIKDVVVGIMDNTSAVFNTPIISVETILKRLVAE
jgi:cell division ATPase FtsA